MFLTNDQTKEGLWLFIIETLFGSSDKAPECDQSVGGLFSFLKEAKWV